MRLFFAVFLFTVLSSSASLGQSSAVVPYFPSTAFVTKRLLPFLVVDKHELVRVKVTGESDCTDFVDPYYDYIFHVYCNKAGSIKIEVQYRRSDGSKELLQLTDIIIADQSAPAPTSTPTPTETESAQ